MHTMSESNPIPSEVVIKIFGELSLPDALHLAATCCRHRRVLEENMPTIYRSLRRKIQCEGYARVLLADQGGLPSDSPLVTIRDLLRLRRNSRRVEKTINVFDRDITPHIRSEYKLYLYETGAKRYLLKFLLRILMINFMGENRALCI